MTRSELDHAIQASFDGTLTEAGCLELRAALKSDPAARALYYEYADLHQSLTYRISRITSFHSAKSLAEIRLHLQGRRTARMTILAAAAALVILGVVMKLTFVSREPALATFQGATGSIYAIEHATGKAGAADSLSEGSIVNLSQGTFEFTLGNGTRGVVLAPAEFELRSEKEMRLERGTAWFEVSAQGKGFQVSTPELSVTDLGTEFGILADPEAGDEVHVFSGRVEALGARGATEMLTTGQARRYGPTGKLDEIPAKPGRFLSNLPDESTSALIVNGDFESGSRPDDKNFGAKATAALLPGWNFGRDIKVALHSANGVPGLGSGWSNLLSPTADVQVSFSSNAPPGDEVGTLDNSIWQTFATIPGQDYDVRFDMGGYFVSGSKGNLRITAKVYDGLATSGRAIGQTSARRAGNRNSDNGYNRAVSFTFTARSTQTTLMFTETSPNSYNSAPALDNVVVTRKDGPSPEKDLPPGN